MSINEIIERIKSKCNEQNYLNVIEEIDLRIKSGSTGSEIMAMVGKYLFDLKKQNLGAYKILESEILAYLKYCKENGIIVS